MRSAAVGHQPEETLMENERRKFLIASAAFGLGTLGLPPGQVQGYDKPKGDNKEQPEEEVGAAEDLMREHGVLNRILLIYEEGLRRLDAREPLPGEAIASSAGIVRRFIEGYHEKLEEDFLFPRLEKASDLAPLVATLRRPHDAG